MKHAGIVLLTVAAVATSVQGVDYKKNTVSGTSSNTSTFISFSSSSSSSMSGDGFVGTDWDDFGLKGKSIDDRIKTAEAKLNRLYFIRDVCPKLESEIKIAFDQKDIRDVLKQLSEMLGTKLPYEVPAGQHLIEKSDVAGMPADQFLNTIAGVCGLKLTYTRNKLVFNKPRTKTE